jgi:hypothetical protein
MGRCSCRCWGSRGAKKEEEEETKRTERREMTGDNYAANDVSKGVPGTEADGEM